MSSDYSKIVKGKLSFKGDSKKKVEKRKISESQSIGTFDGSHGGEGQETEVKILNGTGRLTSSGTTVHGQFTEFMSQLSPGDAIIVNHPTTLQDETKIVRMVLSNVSIGISSAFSSDLITTAPFRYIKAPKDKVSEEEIKNKDISKKHKAEELAFGTYASQGGSKFVYRVKKDGAFGGYKIISETNNQNMSREELLDKRAKKKSDRFCN